MTQPQSLGQIYQDNLTQGVARNRIMREWCKDKAEQISAFDQSRVQALFDILFLTIQLDLHNGEYQLVYDLSQQDAPWAGLKTLMTQYGTKDPHGYGELLVKPSSTFYPQWAQFRDKLTAEGLRVDSNINGFLLKIGR